MYKFHHLDCKRIELENKRDLFLDLLEKENGTLFIENVDFLNWGDQIELLNFLKTGIDNNTKPRIVCGSGNNLLKKSEEGSFSIDLYYQLSVVYLKIPPVRDREGDIGPLLERTLRDIEPTKSLSTSAKKIFTPISLDIFSAATKFIDGKIILSFFFAPIASSAKCIAAVPLEQTETYFDLK